MPAFSRKNSRFSGTNRLNRVRLICSVSTHLREVSVVDEVERHAVTHPVLRAHTDRGVEIAARHPAPAPMNALGGHEG